MRFKAIKITKDNQRSLEQQYDLDPDQLDDVIGMYLIATFGENIQIEGYLTPARFTEMFQITDTKLLNDYIEVMERPIHS